MPTQRQPLGPPRLTPNQAAVDDTAALPEGTVILGRQPDETPKTAKKTSN